MRFSKCGLPYLNLKTSELKKAVKLTLESPPSSGLTSIASRRSLSFTKHNLKLKVKRFGLNDL